MPSRLQTGDALLLVDMQNDYMPGGSLPVPDADKIIPVVNDWIAAAREVDIPVYAVRTLHPFNHVSFETEGGPWPPHCVQDTRGAAFHPEVDFKEDVIIVTTGDHPDIEAYSAFEGSDLAPRLKKLEVDRLWVGGLAMDYRIRASVLDAVEAGLEVHLILPATKALKKENEARVLSEMKEAGVVIEENAIP